MVQEWTESGTEAMSSGILPVNDWTLASLARNGEAVVLQQIGWQGSTEESTEGQQCTFSKHWLKIQGQMVKLVCHCKLALGRASDQKTST